MYKFKKGDVVTTKPQGCCLYKVVKIWDKSQDNIDIDYIYCLNDCRHSKNKDDLRVVWDMIKLVRNNKLMKLLYW